MKTLVVLLSFAFCTFNITAQTAEKIIQESIDAMGGKAWDKVQGMRFSASVEQGGMNIPLDIVFMRDGRTYTKFSIQGMDITEMAFDGTTLWSTNFMNQKPEKLDMEAQENYKRTLGEFPMALMNHKSLGYTVTLEGEETVDGAACHKMKLIKNSQIVEGVEMPKIEYHFIDKDSKALIATESEIMSGEMKGKIWQLKYSDYQEVDGCYVAFSQSMGIKDGPSQAITMTKIEMNPTVDPANFQYTGE